ncbi:MAG: YebC/PmpR family DNA-binding transcriptional regulator [Myxococcales bacterium]|nr:YebC/PmpR family DNA-binding transcriptional regulator [Myxococcales bacterium]
MKVGVGRHRGQRHIGRHRGHVERQRHGRGRRGEGAPIEPAEVDGDQPALALPRGAEHHLLRRVQVVIGRVQQEQALGHDGHAGRGEDAAGDLHVEVEAQAEVLSPDRAEAQRAAVEAGAEDVEPGDEAFVVTTDYSALHEVNRALTEAGFNSSEARLVRVASNTVAVEGSLAEQTLALLEAFDEHDDVSNVFTNADISDEEMERLSS